MTRRSSHSGSAQRDERHFGLAVMDCDGGDGDCPGLRDGLIVNRPLDGIPPRCFFIRPRGRTLEEVQVVIIGQNPGSVGAFERRFNGMVRTSRDRFERTAEAMVESTRQEKYYVALDRLLDSLWPPKGREQVVLFTEIVYCESKLVPDKKNPWKAKAAKLEPVVPFCTELHLEKQLAAVPRDVTVICNGNIAAYWFAKWAAATEFKGQWFSVGHSSGSPTFKSLFEHGKLKPEVLRRWRQLCKDKIPVHLGDGKVYRVFKGRNGKARVVREAGGHDIVTRGTR